MRRAADWRGGGACGGGALAGGGAGRVLRRGGRRSLGAPRRRPGAGLRVAKNVPKTRCWAGLSGSGSRASAKVARHAVEICENIIGRSVPGFCARLRSRSAVRVAVGASRAFTRLGGGGTLALFHQPASEHGGGVFFQPGIQQLSDLLAEIGCVAEPGKLVALQGIAGRREQKLPRWLGFIGVQGDLRNKINGIITLE